MINESKYKRWAWGALVGLAAVIIIAGLIMVMSLQSPKPNTKNDVAKANTETVSEEKNEKSTSTTTDTKSTQNSQKTETESKTTENTTSNKTSESQSKNTISSSSSSVKTTESTASESIPKTGPEDYLFPIFALAACGYLFALNAQLFKKNA